ncbi:MAG: AmmeMemoRadiSam system protein B, partial [Kiritimatiellae bacterium]|nr:AmmeMemoRadiSam system protein B [Kiritimatiellia bacterium]
MSAAISAHTGCMENAKDRPAADEAAPRAAQAEKRVLASSLAGSWYSDDPGELRAAIRALLPKPAPAPAANICAALVPHAGYQFSGRVAAAVLARLRPEDYDRVVLLAPSHYRQLSNAISMPDVTHIGTPLGEVELDLDFMARVRGLRGVISDPRAHDREHSVQIQIPLLQVLFGERLRVVPIVVGQTTPSAALSFSRQLGRLLDKRTLVLTSSDFTHYGPNYEYVPFSRDVQRKLKELDHSVFDRFAATDLDGFWRVLEETGATVCGRCPIAILMGMLPSGARVHEVAYDTSGNQLDDWNNSVSYLGALVEGAWPSGAASDNSAHAGNEPATLPPEARAQLLSLARTTLEICVRGDDMPTLEEAGVELTPPLEQVMGGFVTLTINGELRGCIGEISPSRPIWEVVREQAVNAACNDPRFTAVTQHEAAKIRIEI